MSEDNQSDTYVKGISPLLWFRRNLLSCWAGAVSTWPLSWLEKGGEHCLTEEVK